MEHVVFFPAPDGAPAFRRVSSIEDAVHLVEHLRNVEGVPEVSVHALTEVPLSFRPWFRVELPGSVSPQPTTPEDPDASGQPAAAPQSAAPQPPVELEPLVVVPEQAGAPTPLLEPVAVAEPVDESVVEPIAEPVVEPIGEPAAVEPVAAGRGHVAAGPKSLGFFA